MTKLRVDMSELTLGELAEAAELIGQPIHEAIVGMAQPKAIAAMVAVLQRRDDPTYTLEQALGLRMADIDMVNPGDDPEKASAGSNGGGPALLPAPGG